MLKMSSQIENIVNAYKRLSKIPSITGGRLNNGGTRINANWSIRNFDKGKNSKYHYNYTLDGDLNVVGKSDFGVDISNELLSAVSLQGTFKAIIREEKNGKDSKKQFLEVWNNDTLEQCVDLTALDIHGDVYADSEFGSLDWSADESSLVYVAEKKQQKSEPYIKRKAEDKTKADGSGENAPKKGEEFIYRQDWGEQLIGKFSSVLVVFKLNTETFSVLEGLPEDWCPGQARFSPDGDVVGVAWPTEPRRLGLIFCTNRPSYIFKLTLDGTMKKLSGEGLSVRSPRYNSHGDLVWLQRTASGPHHACHQLVQLKKDSDTVTTVVDIINEVDASGFHGIYSLGVPGRCFSSDGRRLLFSTPQRNEVRSYIVDMDGGRIVDISIKTAPGSTAILDVCSDVILASYSNMTTPGQLYVCRLPAQGSEVDMRWVRVTSPLSVPPTLAAATVEYLDLNHENCNDSVKSFSAIYMSPKVDSGVKVPLVVWPHGGPHSNFVNAYSLEAAFFNMLGFASLQINYRGSTGFGEASVNYLPKRVGDADVKDCKLATDAAIKAYPIDSRKLCLFGGSHGGFLVTHLSGQYPDLYRVVVTRNPVIDVASMFSTTDIADWWLETLLWSVKHVMHYKNISKPFNSTFSGLTHYCLSPNGYPFLFSYDGKRTNDSFASARINYRGSIGYGENAARCLIGHVGVYDVADCYLTLTTLIERERHKTCVLYGGSYGGLVSTHLAGQYPDMFKAMVLRNPLIDLATKGYYADNSDGCAVEAGFDFKESGEVSEEELLAMRRCSPLAHVHRVKAPTAVMLGAGDKRVPCHQGLDYARRLKANGVDTRVYMYEDNHSLSSPPAEMDNLINSADWFLQHLDS